MLARIVVNYVFCCDDNSSIRGGKGIAGIKKFILDNRLDDTAAPLEITYSERNGNKTTIAEYHSRWEDMLKFAYLRGDYRSATLLNRKLCPRNPYPLDPSTVAEQNIMPSNFYQREIL